jgi:hypothetical protein
VFGRESALGNPDDVCHFSLTSGTTGLPKAAMLSHRNLLYMGQALGEVDPLKPGDDYPSFLPLAWIGEQMMTVAVALATGLTVNFPESSETAMHDLVEIGPHVMFAPPRVWENVQSQMFLRMQECYGPNRALYHKLLKWSTDAADASLTGQKPGTVTAFKRWLAYWGLTRPLLDQLGFLRLKRAHPGGGWLPEYATRADSGSRAGIGGGLRAGGRAAPGARSGRLRLPPLRGRLADAGRPGGAGRENHSFRAGRVWGAARHPGTAGRARPHLGPQLRAEAR